MGGGGGALVSTSTSKKGCLGRFSKFQSGRSQISCAYQIIMHSNKTWLTMNGIAKRLASAGTSILECGYYIISHTCIHGITIERWHWLNISICASQHISFGSSMSA